MKCAKEDAPLLRARIDIPPCKSNIGAVSHGHKKISIEVACLMYTQNKR
jgi:hypothetical protein